MKQVYKMIKMFILRDKREPGSSQGSLTFAQIGLKWGGGELHECQPNQPTRNSLNPRSRDGSRQLKFNIMGVGGSVNLSPVYTAGVLVNPAEPLSLA